MRDDVPTDGLAAVGAGEDGACTGVGLNLVRHEDGEVEFLIWVTCQQAMRDVRCGTWVQRATNFCHMLDAIEVEAEGMLALAELPTTWM